MNSSRFYFGGREAERKFASFFPKIQRATVTQDRYEGWDFIVPDWGRVNVKGLSKKRRSDNHFQEDHVWVELRTVDGRPGWAMSETVDAIAFETHEGFLLIEQDELFCCVMEKLVFKPGTAPYHLHSRPGRLDLVVRVPIQDIKDYQHAIIPTSD